jgi:hypothetical protein
MSKIYIVFLIVVALAFANGCKTESGSREFIPGKGWVPN